MLALMIAVWWVPQALIVGAWGTELLFLLALLFFGVAVVVLFVSWAASW